jgi:hypothetical protein
MKTIRLFIIVAIFLAINSFNPLFGQKLKSEAVPEDVKQTMEFEYPNVKITFWELNNNVYVANFKEDNSPGKCYIQKDGQWQKTVYPVPRAELPSAITDYVKNNYANYSIAVSQLQEMPNVRIHYYIEAKPEGVGYESSTLTFNEVGTLIERKDPDKFDKEAKTVVDQKAPTASTVAKSGSDKGNSSTSAKPAQSTSPKSNTSTGKPASTPSNNNKATASNNKPSTSPSSAKPNSNPSTNKPSSGSAKPSTTPDKPKADTPKTSSTAEKQNESKPVSKPTATNSAKPVSISNNGSKTENKNVATTGKNGEDKSVYDERGNKAINPNDVPNPVKTAFAKKVQRPEELNWFKVDTFYVANCVIHEQKNEFFYSKNGVWNKTYTVIPETSVGGNMSKHLQTYYKGYRFKNAIKETRADKKDVVMVEIYEKNNYKQKLVTTLFFDKTGKLINTVDPNYELGGQVKESAEDESLEKYYEKMNMSNKADDNNIPKDVYNAFKAKYPHASGVKWTETDNGDYAATYYSTRGKEVCVINSYGVITETMTLGNPDNLLSSISTYIKQNHKNNKVVEYYAVKKIVDKKNFYKVIIIDKKTKVEQELWFTTSGKIVE